MCEKAVMRWTRQLQDALQTSAPSPDAALLEDLAFWRARAANLDGLVAQFADGGPFLPHLLIDFLKV